MNQLAINGGKPLRDRPFSPWKTITDRDIEAANRVLTSGVLSEFIGAWDKNFYGGVEVQAFEAEWSATFNIKHSISMNSATSCLYAAIGALELGPGDEVIVTPTSMSASATAPLIYGAIPVFADVDPNLCTLSPASVEAKITERTRAILVVNIFGHPAHMDELLAIAKKHNLYIIEDNAQAPMARYKEKFAGTIGDIGIFSLNCHKHVQTGEGGVCVTNNDRLAERLQLIRNHAEAVVGAKEESNIVNLVGWNYRITELQAAIGRTQLEQLPNIAEDKSFLANYLSSKISDLTGINPTKNLPDCQHTYYIYPLHIDSKSLGISREQFVHALQAEGIPIAPKYVKPLYLAPLFQQKIAFGKYGYPFSDPRNSPPSYSIGICPTAEKLYNETLCYIPWCSYDFSKSDVDDIANAITKVWDNRLDIK